MGDYYIYRHRRKDNLEIFYVGASKQDFYKRAKTKKGRNLGWKEMSKKGYEVEIIVENLSYEDACELENIIIKTYGRLYTGKGSLTNVKEGGNIPKGKPVSEKQKKYLSDINKGKNNPRYGKRKSKEEIEKIIQSRKGFKHSEESKLKISNNRKGKHKGLNNNRSVKVKDTKSNIIYSCIREAAEKNNMNYQKLADMVSGRKYNNTTFIRL